MAGNCVLCYMNICKWRLLILSFEQMKIRKYRKSLFGVLSLLKPVAYKMKKNSLVNYLHKILLLKSFATLKKFIADLLRCSEQLLIKCSGQFEVLAYRINNFGKGREPVKVFNDHCLDIKTGTGSPEHSGRSKLCRLGFAL